MSRPPEFVLFPIARLRAHEQIDETTVAQLAAQIRAAGVVADPVWVARGSHVILNGHHRVAALKRLGAKRVPAWLIDYGSDDVLVEPWRPGELVSKEEVVRRGRVGHLFPPKSTRHHPQVELPARPVPLADLLAPRAKRSYAASSAPSRRGGAGASGSG